MFTLEIDGTPVAVTDADENEARELFASAGFKQDLKEFTSGGNPVWNGTSAFTVRPANENEIDYFEEAALDDDDFDDEDLEDEEDGEEPVESSAEDAEFGEFEDDGSSILFLIEIDQLSEEV